MKLEESLVTLARDVDVYRFKVQFGSSDNCMFLVYVYVGIYCQW